MAQSAADDDFMTIDEAIQEWEIARATLYRHIRKGNLRTYRRGMDRHVYVRHTELEALRRFRPAAAQAPVLVDPPSLAEVERARAFQRRVFGDRVLATPSAALIAASRRERTDALP